MKKLLLSFLPVIVALVLVGSPSVGIAQTTDGDFQNALTQLRAERQAFKDAKAEEKNKAAEERQATAQAKREAAQQKRAEAQQKMETQKKAVLLKLVDIQIKWMERTKERVQRMPNITDELKTQLAGEVDAAIQNLNAEKAKIEAASGQDAIKALAKEVRDLFKSKHELVKKIVDAIHASRANDAVATAEERTAAMKAKVNELKEQGKDTTEVESDLEDAEGDVNAAQAAIGRKAFREANDDLKGAYQKFREIAQKAKGLQ